MFRLNTFYRNEADIDGDQSGGGDSGGGNWTDSINEDYRENISKFNDVDSLAKSYVELEKSMGSRIRIPSQDADDNQRQEFFNKLKEIDGVVQLPGVDDKDGWNDFYNQLGRPESADGYEVPELGEDMPNNMQRDENLEGWFKGIAHQVGLSNSQFKTLLGAWNEVTAEAARAQLDEKGQVTNALKGEWGGDYDRRLGVVSTVLKQFGNEKVVQEFVDSGAGNNPELVKMLYNIGSQTLEDSVLKGGGTPEPTMTELEDSADELRNHAAYMDRDHPQHNSIVNKVFALEQKIALQREKNQQGQNNAYNFDGGISL